MPRLFSRVVWEQAQAGFYQRVRQLYRGVCLLKHQVAQLVAQAKQQCQVIGRIDPGIGGFEDLGIEGFVDLKIGGLEEWKT